MNKTMLAVSFLLILFIGHGVLVHIQHFHIPLLLLNSFLFFNLPHCRPNRQPRNWMSCGIVSYQTCNPVLETSALSLKVLYLSLLTMQGFHYESSFKIPGTLPGSAFYQLMKISSFYYQCCRSLGFLRLCEFQLFQTVGICQNAHVLF